MRITFVSQGSALGGAERSLLDLMSAIRSAVPGAAIALLAGAEGDLAACARRDGVSVSLLPLPAGLGTVGDSGLGRGGIRGLPFLARTSLAGALSLRGHAAAMREHLRRLSPDLVHTNDAKSHLLASLAAPPDVPVIWHIRDFIRSRPFLRRLMRWWPRRPAFCAAISRAVARDVRVSLPWARVVPLLNAVDLDHFAPAPADGSWLDREAGLPPAEPGVARVGLVAAYAWWKGHEIFLRAVRSVIEADPAIPARFYVVGGPIYRTRGSQVTVEGLREVARSLGLEERIGLVGFQRDPARVYRSLDVVVHASTRPEPFGRTIAEGMACGRAVIASPDGGSAELFTDGHDAVAANARSPESLAAAIARLVEDPGARERLGRQARLTALDRFSIRRLGREAAALYEEALSDAKKRSG